MLTDIYRHLLWPHMLFMPCAHILEIIHYTYIYIVTYLLFLHMLIRSGAFTWSDYSIYINIATLHPILFGAFILRAAWTCCMCSVERRLSNKITFFQITTADVDVIIIPEVPLKQIRIDILELARDSLRVFWWTVQELYLNGDCTAIFDISSVHHHDGSLHCAAALVFNDRQQHRRKLGR